MTDTPNPPLTGGELADRILAAVNHGLRFAEADPDSLLPETVNAVLAAVQPALDQLRTQLALRDEAITRGEGLRQAALAETNQVGSELDRLRAELTRLRACDCFPNPNDHADRCPIYEAFAPAAEEC